MHQFWKRLAGAALLAGAVIGIVLSAAGLGFVWIGAPRVQAKLSGLLDLSGRALETTQTGLAVISDSLDKSQKTVQLMGATASDISVSIDQTVPMVQSTAGLAGNDMTGVIKNTQNSLNAARASAGFVDDTLNLITSLPIIGQRYKPNASLSDSIGQISKSLDGLPGSLAELQQNLNTSADNLKTIRDKVQTLSTDIQSVDISLGEAKTVVQSYQAQVTELQADLGKARQQLPTWIGAAKWAVSLFFLWLALAQIGLALQGLELLRAVPERTVVEAEGVMVEETEKGS
ncbi:MAG TPA: hypothetical protein VGJ97_12370 [Anaerolineaceae bacterium]|jgi:uncharacterized protein YoxC